jgi:hypothetical protein
MTYREMVMDAGYDPDSDEGRQMAAALEAQEEAAYYEQEMHREDAAFAEAQAYVEDQFRRLGLAADRAAEILRDGLLDFLRRMLFVSECPGCPLFDVCYREDVQCTFPHDLVRWPDHDLID